MSVSGSEVLDQALLRIAALERQIETLMGQQGRIKHNFSLTEVPDTLDAYSDANGYQAGSLGVVNDVDAYICVDPTSPSPVWKKITP